MFAEALPDLFLQVYRQGLFPMAESAEREAFHFYRPNQRGQLSIPGLHIPKRLRSTIRHAPYKITVNKAFEDVIDGCARKTEKRQDSWINPPIRDGFVALHRHGHAHSVECWREDKTLAGGIYGLALGGVFCGESMFSNARDASKIALVHLCARLWKAGFQVFDTQFTNPHLEQFGVYEISADDYDRLLMRHQNRACDFHLKSFAKSFGASESDLVNAYLAFNQNYSGSVSDSSSGADSSSS